MRSLKAPLETWSFADGNRDGASAPGFSAEEPFDSFGPISDIRHALNMPSRPVVPQGPHDFTRILVAEDDAFSRRVLRVLLSSPRMSVIEVEEGQAAVDLLALRSFDLMILDLTLPLMTGEDVIRWVRRNHTPWSDIPILGLVDDTMRGQVGRLMSLGMTDWTAKPLSRHHLADKIVHLMPGLFDAGL
jgi:CheY-like chemotaxis protein